MSHEIIIGEHFYDPPRFTYHELFRDISTDPNGENWLRLVYERSYGPLMESGVLRHISYDINQVLLQEMRRNGLPTEGFIRGQADNVIGTSYIHPILPDLSDDDKRIVIGAGLNSYYHDFGCNPTIFWPPEAAMDTATARVLLEFGYKAFVCAPWQLQTADGSPADNRPMRVSFGTGSSLVAIPYDRDLSSQLAFGDKRDANRFRDLHIRPRLRDDGMIISWTDGETFGHHAPFADLFLYYLLTQSLPEIGLKPTPINQIDFNGMNLTQAQLIERTAWSCLCGDLARWHQGCGCSNGNDASWKPGYYGLFDWLNQSITVVVSKNLGRDYVQIVTDNFEAAFVNPGGRFTNPELSAVAAKGDALTARTSCGTFFVNPHTAGRINILFGLEALQHLRDAGLTRDADRLQAEYMTRLQGIVDPANRSQTLADVTAAMLGTIRVEQFV